MKLKDISKVALSSLLAFSVISCQTNIKDESISNSNLQSETVEANKANSKIFVNLNTNSPKVIDDLAADGMDIFGSSKTGFSALLSKTELNTLGTKNVKYTVDRKNSTRGRMPGGYQTYAQAVSKMKQFASQYKNIVSMVDIGDSWEKTQGKAPTHDVWAMVINNKSKKIANKKTVAFISGIHARELPPVEINMNLLELLLTSYGKDAKITEWIDTREIVIIPVVNVDGRVHVQNGSSMWRKNRHIDRTHPDGVDLNRNYDGHWNFEGIPSNPTIERFKRNLQNKRSQIYSGTKPFSEPESQALDKFFRNKDLAILIDYHAYGEMVLWPPGYQRAPVPDTPLLKKIGTKLTSMNGYRGGTSPELLYHSCGTSKDWGYDQHKAMAYTIELGDRGFNPPFSSVKNIWDKNKSGALYLISIGDNVKKAL